MLEYKFNFNSIFNNSFENQNKENYLFDKANRIVGGLMFANTTKEQLFNLAAKTGELSPGALKYVKFIKGTGIAGSVFGIGVSGFNIYNDLSNDRPVDGWDVSDLGVGLLTGLGAAIFLASNPVGWVIGIGAGVYFTGRLIYDVTHND